MKNSNCYRRYYPEEEKEEQKKRAQEIFMRMPEHILIEILGIFLIDGESSKRNDTIYKMVDGKIIKIEK